MFGLNESQFVSQSGKMTEAILVAVFYVDTCKVMKSSVVGAE
jgi:hypothetical protein